MTADAKTVTQQVIDDDVPLGLPTEDELKDARDWLSSAQDALEALIEDTTKVDEWSDKAGRPNEFPFGVTVDDAAFGRLFRFLADARADIRELGEKLDELDSTVRSLHLTDREHATYRKYHPEGSGS